MLYNFVYIIDKNMILSNTPQGPDIGTLQKKNPNNNFIKQKPMHT